MNKAVLVLEDGSVFEGASYGATGTATGEIAFNTGMTGYQEIFTDPSYYGQVLLMTTSHIGNYGINEVEKESENIQISALVCKKFSETFSRADSIDSLENWFVKHNKIVISDIDTRSLVRKIRNAGAMNCIISNNNFDTDQLKEQLSRVPSMEGLGLSSKVSTTKPYYVGDESGIPISVLDLGVKQNILNCLVERGGYLKVFPYNASAEDILAFNPKGIMLSNGPGDPAALNESIETVKNLIDTNIPMFGICLGHQILAIASGLSTKKMHNGHRGVNHPVINLATTQCEVTSQNHGFVIDEKSVANNTAIEVTHKHLNDNTVAGIKYNNKPVFSVQYHPESSAGPNDSRYLFDDFFKLINQ